jgi:hypothetical protein
VCIIPQPEAVEQWHGGKHLIPGRNIGLAATTWALRALKLRLVSSMPLVVPVVTAGVKNNCRVVSGTLDLVVPGAGLPNFIKSFHV